MKQTIETNYPKYPAYKDFGVECLPAGQVGLGEIPKGWEVRKLKMSTRINVNTLPENTRKYFEIEYVDIGNVILKKEYTRPKNSFLKMLLLEPGELHMRAIQSFLRSGLT